MAGLARQALVAHDDEVGVVEGDLVADRLHRLALDGHGVDLVGAGAPGHVAGVARLLLGGFADDLVRLVAERALGLGWSRAAAGPGISYAQTIRSFAPASAAICAARVTAEVAEEEPSVPTATSL